MSDIEKGTYGKSSRIVNFDRYNPLGNRIVPFKAEKVCSFCESKCDVIFPINPKLCPTCVNRIRGRQDIARNFRPKMDFTGYRCDLCGMVTYFPVITNTRACNKCTWRLDRQTKVNNARRYGARRVV